MPRIAWLAAAASALLLATAPGAPAQERLTLDRAVQDALANSPGLRVARAATTETDARVTEARAAYFPRVSFTEAWQRGDEPVFVFGSLLNSRQFAASNFAIDALNHPEPTGFFHGAFGVEQLLFDGGRVQAGIAAARHQRDIATLGVTQAEADVALAATQIFGRLLMAQAAQRSAESAVTAASEDAARAERRRDAGMVTDADVLALQVHLADMRQRAIQARGDAAVARAELNRLIGRPVDAEYEAEEPPPALPVAPDLHALLAEADASRPELRRAEAEQRLAEAGVREARAAWWPQIAAQAGYELNGTSFTDRASAWIVGGQLRWGISAGGAEAAHQHAASAALVRARAAADDARGAVHVEVASAVQRLESARARQTVAQTAVAQARETQRIVRDRYEGGLAGVTDVLRAATAVIDADAQRIAALVDALTSDAALRRAVGRR